MRDEIDGRLWEQHHGAFSDGISQLVDQIRVSLRRLHRLQFDAPWRHGDAKEA